MSLDDRVAIVGVGITKHGFFPEWSWKRMIVESCYEALGDAGMEAGEIEGGLISVTAPEIAEQQNMGAVASDELGMAPSGFAQVVSACAGGGVGLQYAVQAIKSGVYKKMLVVGIEKISDSPIASQSYITSIDADHTGRYLYYSPGAHGKAPEDGTALVQFDTRTRKRKVIAFLAPFLSKKYGYTPIGTFGTTLSPKGDRVYMTWHGNRTGGRWDSCAMTVVHIPESERRP